jgi:hypothetical protein
MADQYLSYHIKTNPSVQEQIFTGFQSLNDQDTERDSSWGRTSARLAFKIEYYGLCDSTEGK